MPLELPPEPVLDKVIPWLDRQDAESRERRARDWIEVQKVVNTFPAEAWGLSAGGNESSWFLLQSVGCYRQGLFLASLVCAHATCEQEIAGRLAYRIHKGDSAPKGWERWGLGRLVEHAESEGWYSPKTRELLKLTNENRRSVYHMREFFAPDSLFTRTYQREPFFDKWEITHRMHEQLRIDSLDAVRAAFAIRVDD